MTSNEIRKKFLEFFQKRGHAVIPSSSLVPENDSSVLFTTAGMQQLKPYYTGKKNPQTDFNSLNIVSIQKCVRTSDIEEVGDESHLTFFEMLGNFSFGGYWKKEAIEYAYNFITQEMGLKIDYVSVFLGEANVPADLESEKIWKSIDQNITVKKFGREDNFWGPTGLEGPCGPTTEIYVDGIEIWNIVFNEFYQDKDKNLKTLDTKGVDTGMGLERLTKVVQKVKTVFDTDLFNLIIQKIDDLSKVNDIHAKRIVADHIRTAVFMITDGVVPSNVDRGYVLRRLIRRAMNSRNKLELEYGYGETESPLRLIVKEVTEKYKEIYRELDLNIDKILTILRNEEEKFNEALFVGQRKYEEVSSEPITGATAFGISSTLGISIDLIKDWEKEKGRDVVKLKEEYDKEVKKHQELSRKGGEQKFKAVLE